MKKRFFFIFLMSFVFTFVVLNSRFLYANTKFWLLTGTVPSNLPLPSATPSPKPSSRPLPTQVPLPNQATLVIDSLGVSAPIVFNVGDKTDAIYKNLENGVVHYSSSPKPGESGASIILGHSSAYPWYKGQYGSVFALLGRLQPGDKFYIKYEDGRTFNFVMKQSIIFNPFGGEDSRLSEIEAKTKPTVILLSCWPVGTNYKRIAIEAELI